MSDNKSFTNESIRDEVRRVVGTAVDLPPEAISENRNLYREYGLDSLGALFVFIELHEVFDIPEPENEAAYAELSTVDKIVDFVEQSLTLSRTR